MAAAAAAAATDSSAVGATQNGAAAAANNNNGTPATVASTSSTTTTTNTTNTQNHAVSGLDPNRLIPIQITLPAQADSESRVLTIHMPGSAIQNNQLSQMLTGPIIQSIMNLPPQLASSVLQQHVNLALQNHAMQSKWRLVRHGPSGH